jgi:polyisoprenoid-binding protein YceI
MVKSFKFEKALMQEHFNENYMESSAFPKADFKGKISNITEVNFTKDGTYKVTVAGKLTIHGVAQEVAVPGTITVKGKDVTATAKFTVKLQDYKISVPTMVADKLAKEATISVDAILNQK